MGFKHYIRELLNKLKLFSIIFFLIIISIVCFCFGLLDISKSSFSTYFFLIMGMTFFILAIVIKGYYDRKYPIKHYGTSPHNMHIYHHDVQKERKDYENSIEYGGRRMVRGGLADSSSRVSKVWDKGLRKFGKNL